MGKMNSKARTKMNPNSIFIKLLKFEVQLEYENFEKVKETDGFESHLYYSINSEILINKLLNIVKVYFKYRLEFESEQIDYLFTIHTFEINSVKELITIDENKKISLKNSLDIHLAKMSLAHSRGYHAIKIQKSLQPNLFIPFVDEQSFVQSITVEEVSN